MLRRLLLLLFFFPVFLHAGKQDSLTSIIENTSHDSAGIRKLILLSDKLALTDGDASLRVIRSAYDIAKESGNKKMQLETMLSLGVCLMNQGEYVPASEYLFPALTLCDSLKDDAGKLRALNSIGNLYAHQDQMDVAIGYYEKALALAQKTGNERREGVILNNLGNIYYMRTNIDSANLLVAKKYYESGYAIAKKSDELFRRITVMNNLVLVYTDMKNFAAALALADTVGAYCVQTEDSADLAYTYSNIGRIYLMKKEFQKGIDYYNRCVSICEKMNNRDLMAEAFVNLARCYSQSGDYKTAFDYQVRYSSLYDSLINTSNTEIISNLKNKIETERHEGEIKELKQINEISDLRNSRQNLYLVLAIGGLLLLGVLAFLLYNRSLVKEKANRLLNGQNLVIAQKNKDITDSINYAQRIQQALLAHDEFLGKNLPEHFILFKPKDIVSGDFYWAAANDEKIFFAVCDCTGHGVPGAFMSLLNISFLNEAINEKNIVSPELIFNHSRERLIASVSKDGGQDGMDGILLCINKADGKISYCAAQNAPVIIRNGTVINMPYDKMPVGKGDQQHSFTLHEAGLLPGDMFYLFTDGYADQFGGPQGKKLKSRQLNQKLAEISGLPVSEQRKALDAFFYQWKNVHEQVDDVLLVGIRI